MNARRGAAAASAPGPRTAAPCSEAAAAGLAELLSCLEEEERAGRELRRLARCKQRVLVGGTAADLPPLVQAEQVMLAGLSRSEVRRAAAARPLAESLGLPPGASLEQLAGAMDPAAGATLRDAGRRISVDLAEIRSLNEQNTRLIRQSLAFVNFSRGLIARAMGEVETYAPGGRRPRRGFFPRAVDQEA